MNKHTNKLSTSLLSLCFIFTSSAQEKSADDFCFEGDEACSFVVFSEFKAGDSQQLVINTSRANARLTPFSTFKVPNSVIGLETGLIKDSQQILTYDKSKYPSEPWWPAVWKAETFNLTSAFKYSMVPIYRELATKVGITKMQHYLKQFNYGNQDISSGLDDFWLNGSIKISALEQVTFLKKLYNNDFSLSEHTLNTMKEVMLVKETENYKLYAKTGTGRVDDKSMLAWYVGFVENDKGRHFFALNLNRATYGEVKAIRKNIALNHLKKMHIID
jgi:beta-lactamase class D